MIDYSQTTSFFTSLLQLYVGKDTSVITKYKVLRSLLNKISKNITAKEVVQFSNLFSRLSFICNKYQVSKNIHSFRMISNELRELSTEELEVYFSTYWKDVNEFVSHVYNVPVPDINRLAYPIIEQRREKKQAEYSNFIDKLKVVVVHKQPDVLICEVESTTTEEHIRVRINEYTVNDIFATCNHFWVGATLYLVNVGIDEHQIYHPKIVVLEPDYLIDVSAIAECFQDFGTSPLLFLKAKFEEISNNKYLLIGNFANAVMDELVSSDDPATVDFNTVFVKHFEAYPFEHTACGDIFSSEDFKQYAFVCRSHFNTIQHVYLNEFRQYGISSQGNISLEPSFLSNVYGIQGRLDLLHTMPSKVDKTTIVELKSGSTPYPDDGFSVKPNHSVQLYLYHLMLSVVNNISFKDIGNEQYLSGFIFYSKTKNGNLRTDQINLARVQEICDIRNRIILNEQILKSDDLDAIQTLLAKINPQRLITNVVNSKFKDILSKQFNEFLAPLHKANELELTYFYSFISFIAREQYISKLGIGNYEGNNGLASLWLDDLEDKKEKYSILFDLEIKENRISTKEKLIVFNRTITDDFVNFREGDICVLYPREVETDIATSHQIFKCSIRKITKETVVVVFRHMQRSEDYFKQFKFWALERDFMDSSFTSMYKGMYSFLNSPAKHRKIMLNQLPPALGVPYGYHKPTLSVEQNRIINNALSAEDYFVLNGPPGTGKTSHIIKELVRELYVNSNQNILLLAYTNKAVDELCETINEALSGITSVNDYKFIRIGSSLSCNSSFHNCLLDNIIIGKRQQLALDEEKFTRGSLSKIISDNRIFVSTVASMSSKDDVFNLKRFDTVIIDEASQILEPQIIGMLHKCKRFIMIGDHKQLPAIVVQEEVSSKTNNTLLEDMGLSDRRNSLFERLFNYCKHNGMDYACDTLTYQGRMHQDIAVFPNINFYDGKLKEAYHLTNLSEGAKDSLARQVRELALTVPDIYKNQLDAAIANKRLLFFNSEEEQFEQSGKVNEGEADLVVYLIKRLIAIYKHNNLPFDVSSKVGIIAPFKNQIALIKNKLEEADIPAYDLITVDTVERFQGGQRDIIIYSFAVNNLSQLESVVNLNEDKTVDRKLNVALTRAKEQIFLIGNASILSQNHVYYKLIEFVRESGGGIAESIQEILASDEVEKTTETSSNNEILHTVVSAPYFSKFFHEEITMPLIERGIYENEVLFGMPKSYIQNNVLEYGRTDFNQPYIVDNKTITAPDKVDLFYLMLSEEYYYAAQAIYGRIQNFLLNEIVESNGIISIVDFTNLPAIYPICIHQQLTKVINNDVDNYVDKLKLPVSIKLFNVNKYEQVNRKADTLVNAYVGSQVSSVISLESIEFTGLKKFADDLKQTKTIVFNIDERCFIADSEMFNLLIKVINNAVRNLKSNNCIIVYKKQYKSSFYLEQLKRIIEDDYHVVIKESESVTFLSALLGTNKTQEIDYEVLCF